MELRPNLQNYESMISNSTSIFKYLNKMVLKPIRLVSFNLNTEIYYLEIENFNILVILTYFIRILYTQLMNTITINQQLQPVARSSLIHNQSLSYLESKIRPSNQLQQQQLLKSYALIVNQSLVTKDKSIIKQIFSNQQQQRVIKNTSEGINVDKLAVLLQILEALVLQDSTNCYDRYNSWISAILKVHLGYLVNSTQCRNILAKLKKIIQKRVTNQSQLKKLDSAICCNTTRQHSQIRQQYKPKFHYIQQQQQMKHYSQIDEQQNDDEIDQQNQIDYFDDMEDLM